jgi:hypothetical protein
MSLASYLHWWLLLFFVFSFASIPLYIYLSIFQNHNRMYYIREDQIKAAKGVACWAPHCNKQRELAQFPLCICMVGRAHSGITFVLTFYICVFFYAKNVSFLWNPIYIYWFYSCTCNDWFAQGAVIAKWYIYSDWCTCVSSLCASMIASMLHSLVDIIFT